jgi:hypothetical protein
MGFTEGSQFLEDESDTETKSIRSHHFSAHEAFKSDNTTEGVHKRFTCLRKYKIAEEFSFEYESSMSESQSRRSNNNSMLASYIR